MWLAVLFGTFLTWIFCFIWTINRDDWISGKKMKEEREKRKQEESEISAADKALQAVANMVENALEWTIQGVGNISAIESSDSAERAPCGCLAKSKAKLPYDVDKVRRVVDLSRPMPTREDTVGILKNGHVKLAYVINIDHGLRKSPEYANLVGSLLTTELIPSGFKTKRCIEEAFVVDRGFSLGETVVLYQNEFPDDAKKAIERTSKKGMIGQVVNAKVTSDLLVLPGKTYVARNINLGKVETLDMVNFNSAHNYILYDDWIGDLVNITNDITMIYNGHRFTVRDNGSLALIRKDRSDEQKSCIPGEVVQMLISDVLSSNVKWEKEMPFKLRRLSRKKSALYGDDSITCLVEKVEPVTVEVRWLMSPSSIEHPPKNIEKSDFNKLTKVDLSANLRIAADDRVRVKTTDEDKAITLTEYNKYLDDQYGNKFEQKVKSGNASIAIKSSNSSIVKAVHKAASPPGDEGAPPEKNAKVGSSAEIPILNTEKMEPITEHDDESMQLGETTTDCDEQDANRIDGQRGLVRKAHRPRMKRARVKRMRKNQASAQTNKTTSRQAKELFGDEFIGEVLRTQTTVDVEWMDGTISYDLPGYMLVPVDPDLDQQDHLPGVLVARKDGNTRDELGLILQTDQRERCALVRWLEIAGDAVPVDKGEEQCTLFDIMPHPMYQRMMVGAIGVEIGKEPQKLSDVVFQVKSHLKSGQSEVEYYNGTRATLWPTEMALLFVPEDDDTTQSSDEETDNDESWTNWSIQQEEDLTVDQPSTSSANVTFSNFIARGAKLLFGKESFFKYVLSGPKLNYSDRYIQELISQGKNPTTKEVAERARLSSMVNPKSDEVVLVQSMEEITEANPQARQIEQYIVGTEAVLSKSTTLDLSPEFFGKIIRSPPSTRREGLLAHYESADVDAILAMIDVVPHLNESCLKKDYFYKWLCVVLHAESAIQREYMDELCAKLDLAKEELQKLEQTSDRNAGGLESNESTSSELPTDNSKKGTILTLPACSSHNWKAFEMNAPGKVWMRRIISELNTLREHLPEGIHVIIYEDRVDLLSTVIVGPRGTPYEATPFYFDIRFKSDYPTGPPEVHYHAFSQEQLNPNLYQNGRVCTSLLGTWQGKGVETWNSVSSNLLQVLLSIQALILVPEPFFNEAGYESRKNTPGMNENSQRYNETAMINSLQYLESIARHPPGGSMPIVMDELKKQWPILKAEISSWLEERTTPDFPVQMSKGFRISLERMITRISALNL